MLHIIKFIWFNKFDQINLTLYQRLDSDNMTGNNKDVNDKGGNSNAADESDDGEGMTMTMKMIKLKVMVMTKLVLMVM